MSANVLVIDLKPIVYRWFDPTPTQAGEIDIYLALSDLVTYAGTQAVDEECDLDLIGPSCFLNNCGYSQAILQKLIDDVAMLVRMVYLNQSTPEWRNAGKKRIQVDQYYLMTVKLGIDPYV